jgi:GntR family transcriptional repressor for pyruvate dehydrogenase complex
MLPPNKIIDRRRLYQQIADDIERKILDGSMGLGSRLPGEHLLADEYGVSRNVIREALKRLKENGLVTIRTGSGTYIRQPGTKPISQAMQRILMHNNNKFNVLQFYEVRQMLEPNCASLAAKRGSEEDIQKITSAFEEMEANKDDISAWSESDLKFHQAVALAAHNPLVMSILEPLTDSLQKVISAGYMAPQAVVSGLKAHKQILDAIQKRDHDLAKKAMLDHLMNSQKSIEMLGYQHSKENNIY